jgi:hypothetical protein
MTSHNHSDSAYSAHNGTMRGQRGSPSRVSGWTRRGALGLIAAAVLLPSIGSALAGARLVRKGAADENPDGNYEPYRQAVATVLPWAGHLCRIALKDSVVRTISEGVIDRDKYLALKGGADYLPADCLAALNAASDNTIRLTTTNASEYVDLLWPVGLANHLSDNENGSLAGPDVDNFASTGGWNLGHAETGGEYFNKYAIVDLTADAQELAVRVAKATFRPCCDNSTFFQDCNHGSALFAVLQLGASQGLDEDALYREALAFNSFWFPDTYIATALLFKALHQVDWVDVDPKLVMGPDYSTASGWDQNVWQPLQEHPDLLPPPTNNVNCGA